MRLTGTEIFYHQQTEFRFAEFSMNTILLTLPGYANWAANQSDIEACTEITANGEWKRVACNASRQYICESGKSV